MSSARFGEQLESFRGEAQVTIGVEFTNECLGTFPVVAIVPVVLSP